MEPSLFSYTRSSRARDESRGAGAARVAVGAVHVLEEAPAMASTRFGVGGEGEGDGQSWRWRWRQPQTGTCLRGGRVDAAIHRWDFYCTHSHVRPGRIFHFV